MELNQTAEGASIVVERAKLLSWANNNPQYQAIIASDTYRKEAEEAWLWLCKMSGLAILMHKTREEFYSNLKVCMAIGLASEVMNRFFDGEDDWQKTSVDDNWIKMEVHCAREMALKAYT